MKYICICGNEFEKEPGYVGPCPYCEGAYYEPEEYCHICNAPIPESQGKYGMCLACEVKTLKAFQTVVCALNLDGQQMDYLNDLLEGNHLSDLSENGVA